MNSTRIRGSSSPSVSSAAASRRTIYKLLLLPVVLFAVLSATTRYAKKTQSLRIVVQAASFSSSRHRRRRVLPPFSIRLLALRGGDVPLDPSKDDDTDEATTVASSFPTDDDTDGVEQHVVVVMKADEQPNRHDTSDPADSTTALDPDEESSVIQQQRVQEQATQLRLKGKELHDEGHILEAAETFYQASQLLLPYCYRCRSGEQVVTTTTLLLEDYATCRLHEALCRWKAQDHDKCIQACTDVLDMTQDPQQGGHTAIRARAFYRRARAKLAIHQTIENTDDAQVSEEEYKTGALEDARSAAFMGDRKAVDLYGTLMRESSSSLDAIDDESSASASSSSSALLMQELIQSSFGGGKSTSIAPMATPSSSSSSLLESLLNKSSPTGGVPGNMGGGNPFAGMLLSNLGGGDRDNGGGMAKAVLSSLTKRLEREETQDTICQFLQNTNPSQVQQLASMAGVPLSESHASRLVAFFHGITPKGIRRSVGTTKIVVYVATLMRKILQLISKYRQVIILWVLFSWVKAALLRPVPINKRALRLAKRQALKQATAVL